MCSYITENKECPRKDKCTYAHFRNELIISDCPYSDCKYVRIYNNKYQNTHRYYVCDRRHKNETDSNFFFRTKISDPVTEKEMQDTYDEFVYHYSLLTEQMKKTINSLPCDKVIVYHGFMFNGNATASYKQQKIKEREKIVLTKRWSDFVNTIKSEEPKTEPVPSQEEPKQESEEGWITVTIKTKKPAEEVKEGPEQDYNVKQIYDKHDRDVEDLGIVGQGEHWAGINRAKQRRREKDEEQKKKQSVSEMSAGSVATVVNPTPKNKAKVGTLFGGTYNQKSKKA